MPRDLHDLQQQVAVWQAETFPDHQHPLVKAGKVAEEAGEVVGAVIKVLDGRRRVEDVAAEAAEVVVCLLGLAESLGFDLDVAVQEQWATVRARDFAAAHARSRTTPAETIEVRDGFDRLVRRTVTGAWATDEAGGSDDYADVGSSVIPGHPRPAPGTVFPVNVQISGPGGGTFEEGYAAGLRRGVEEGRGYR